MRTFEVRIFGACVAASAWLLVGCGGAPDVETNQTTQAPVAETVGAQAPTPHGTPKLAAGTKARSYTDDGKTLSFTDDTDDQPTK